MLHEMQKGPKVRTQFVCFVEVHYAYPFRGKDIEKKLHQFLGGLLGVEPVYLARHFKGMAVLRSGRTVFHIQFQLPIC